MGTVLVVAIALVGSLTVLPAVLSKLGDRVDRGRVPFLRRCRGRDGESRFWSAIVGAVLRHPMRLGRSRGRAAGRARDPRVPPAHRELRRAGASARPAGDAGLRPHREGVPRRAAARDRRRQRAGRDRAGGHAPGSTALERAALATRSDGRADQRRRQPPSQRAARVRFSLAGTGTDATSNHALDLLRDTVIPSTIGRVPGVRVHTTGMTADSRDFNDSMKSHAPLRVRLRLRARLPAAAGHVPLDRDPAQGDRAQPALGRRRLRRARAHLPGRPPPVAARLPLDRRHHLVAAALPVRHPLRPLDGLPRAHPEPRARGLRRRHDHRAARSRTASAPPPASSRAPRS